jgi:hypothetical protein
MRFRLRCVSSLTCQADPSVNHTLRNNSDSEILKARAIFSILASATFRSPRSIPPT